MWGFKGVLSYDRGHDGIGIFTSLAPVLGESAIREIQGILNDDDLDFTVDETSNEDLAKAEMKIGYGYRVLDGTAVVSPYSGATFVAGGRNSYRLGSRFELEPTCALNWKAAWKISAPVQWTGRSESTAVLIGDAQYRFYRNGRACI